MGPLLKGDFLGVWLLTSIPDAQFIPLDPP